MGVFSFLDDNGKEKREYDYPKYCCRCGKELIRAEITPVSFDCETGKPDDYERWFYCPSLKHGGVVVSYDEDKDPYDDMQLDEYTRKFKEEILNGKGGNNICKFCGAKTKAKNKTCKSCGAPV